MKINHPAIGVVLAIASALVATALVANVQGFELSPAARFYLTVGQAGLTTAALFCRAPRRARVLPPRG